MKHIIYAGYVTAFVILTSMLIAGFILLFNYLS